MKQKEVTAVSEKAKNRSVTLQKGILLQESNEETTAFVILAGARRRKPGDAVAPLLRFVSTVLSPFVSL